MDILRDVVDGEIFGRRRDDVVFGIVDCGHFVWEGVNDEEKKIEIITSTQQDYLEDGGR